ncbi:hypothetical protein HZA97_02770 [Candidatus Woesearchaeota archaeon]|nr:hypothetical protein [Candidatus Woesearchaeota archaeon]
MANKWKEASDLLNKLREEGKQRVLEGHISSEDYITYCAVSDSHYYTPIEKDRILQAIQEKYKKHIKNCTECKDSVKASFKDWSSTIDNVL